MGVRGKIASIQSHVYEAFIHSLASLPKVPHTLPPGIDEGCISTPNDFLGSTLCYASFIIFFFEIKLLLIV